MKIRQLLAKKFHRTKKSTYKLVVPDMLTFWNFLPKNFKFDTLLTFQKINPGAMIQTQK
jgi:hypothetical protein